MTKEMVQSSFKTVCFTSSSRFGGDVYAYILGDVVVFTSVNDFVYVVPVLSGTGDDLCVRFVAYRFRGMVFNDAVDLFPLICVGDGYSEITVYDVYKGVIDSLNGGVEVLVNDDVWLRVVEEVVGEYDSVVFS